MIVSSTSQDPSARPRCGRRLLVTGLALVVAVSAACGSDDDDESRTEEETTTTESDGGTSTETPATTTTTTAGGGGEVDAAISLSIDVTADGQPLRSATLSCGNTTAEGTDFLADPQAAVAACDLLQTNPDASTRLVEGPNPDLLCTEIYGGPEVATVTGEIQGQPVDTTIDRTDGCGIAAWDTLAPLLGGV